MTKLIQNNNFVQTDFEMIQLRESLVGNHSFLKEKKNYALTIIL